MDIRVKSYKHELGYIEWKNIQKYLNTLEGGFEYYYNGEIKTMDPVKDLSFSRQGRALDGKFRGLFPRPKKFYAKVHNILWPSCNSTKPIVFIIDNTLSFE